MRQSASQSSPALSFRLSADVVRKINDYIRNNMQMLLMVPVIREMVVRDRLAKLKPGDIRRFESHDDAVLKDTVRYNVEQLHAATALGRPSQLIDPLSCIDYVRVHREFLKVLTVGPRTEAEIIALVMAGFVPANIRGLDLISYSEFVDLGDMHDMPFDDDSFDVVILGWVLGYSNDNPRVIKEVLPIAKPGAYIAIGHEYNPIPKAERDKGHKYDFTGPRFDHTDEMLAFFGKDVDNVVFRCDAYPAMKGRTCNITVILQLKGELRERAKVKPKPKAKGNPKRNRGDGSRRPARARG